MSLMSRAWRSSTPGLPTLLIPMFGNLGFAAKDQRKLVGKGDRLDARQFGSEPAHEARAIVARAACRLAELDRILGLEMAPRQVIGGAGERHEGDLALGPQRIDAVAQGRVQSPIRAERQGGVWISGIGSGDAERRPRTVIEIARYGHHDIGGVVGAAQEHHQQPRIGGRRGPDAAGYRQRGQAANALIRSRRFMMRCLLAAMVSA